MSSEDRIVRTNSYKSWIHVRYTTGQANTIEDIRHSSFQFYLKSIFGENIEKKTSALSVVCNAADASESVYVKTAV